MSCAHLVMVECFQESSCQELELVVRSALKLMKTRNRVPRETVTLRLRGDKSTPTKHLTPPPHHNSRPAAAHTGRETHYNETGGRGRARRRTTGPPPPIWPKIGPPKLAPERGGPGPGGQSIAIETWTLILARPHTSLKQSFNISVLARPLVVEANWPH